MVERVGWMPALIDDQQRLRSNRTQLAIVSGFKLIASLLALGVAAWNEVLHQQTSFASQLQAIYIRIALDHVAAVFGIASALADLFAIFEPRKSLNLKVESFYKGHSYFTKAQVNNLLRFRSECHLVSMHTYITAKIVIKLSIFTISDCYLVCEVH